MIVQCLNRSNEYDNIEVKSVTDYVPSHGFSLHKPLGKRKAVLIILINLELLTLKPLRGHVLKKMNKAKKSQNLLTLLCMFGLLALTEKKCMVDTGKILLFYLIKFNPIIRLTSHAILLFTFTIFLLNFLL